ncbi:MAG: hypothetical protein ABIH99_01540 [Candidatus Micrarchaeota archaeon]
MKRLLALALVAVLLLVFGCAEKEAVRGNESESLENAGNFTNDSAASASPAPKLELPSEEKNEANESAVNESAEDEAETLPSSAPVSAVSEENFAKVERNCFGFLVGGGAEEFSAAAESGAGWTRPHYGPFAWGHIEKEKGKFDFNETDAEVKYAGENNITMLATIWPFADWEQTCRSTEACKVSTSDIFYSWGNGKGIPNSRCKPCDMEAYKEFLKKLVERYDGDGVEDMPELKVPVRYWEISNEPEMREETLTFFRGNEQDYVEILEASYDAVKEACPNCTVVQGGAAGSFETNSFWGKIFDLGGAQFFDVANIHYVAQEYSSNLNVKSYKELMESKGVSKPIWVTEAEYREGTSDDEVEASVRGAVDAGASKIFFTRLIVGVKGALPPGKSSSEIYKKIIKEVECE